MTRHRKKNLRAACKIFPLKDVNQKLTQAINHTFDYVYELNNVRVLQKKAILFYVSD